MTYEDIKTIEVVLYPDGRMDCKNASLYTGESEKTLAIKRMNGTGPKYIKPGRIFYYKDDLDDYLLSGGKHTSTEQSKIKHNINKSRRLKNINNNFPTR